MPFHMSTIKNDLNISLLKKEYLFLFQISFLLDKAGYNNYYFFYFDDVFQGYCHITKTNINRIKISHWCG